jgi:F-type H+-transporting ATPase subunit c
MDLEAAKVIGAGLAAIGVGVAATGVGNVFGSFLQGGFAAAELLGLIAFAVAMIILYAV